MEHKGISKRKCPFIVAKIMQAKEMKIDDVDYDDIFKRLLEEK